MGRKRGGDWNHFGTPYSDGRKSKRVDCDHCGESVTAFATNVATHLKNCPKLQQSVGYLRLSDDDDDSGNGPPAAPRSATSSSSVASSSKTLPDLPAGIVRTDRITGLKLKICTVIFFTSMVKQLVRVNLQLIASPHPVTEREEIHRAIAGAVHRLGLPFGFFHQKEIVNVLNLLRPTYRLPPLASVSEDYLDAEYKKVMSQVRGRIRDNGELCWFSKTVFPNPFKLLLFVPMTFLCYTITLLVWNRRRSVWDRRRHERDFYEQIEFYRAHTTAVLCNVHANQFEASYAQRGESITRYYSIQHLIFLKQNLKKPGFLSGCA